MTRKYPLLVATLAAVLSVPGVASAQFGHFGFRPPIYNSLLASRALHVNAYLNNTVANAYAFNARVNANVLNHALVYNQLLGNPLNSQLTSLTNTYLANATNAQAFATNAYLNRVVGNAYAQNALATANLYRALTPNYAVGNYRALYNPITSTLNTYTSYLTPYGAVNRFNSVPYYPYANLYSSYLPYAYNPYLYNPSMYAYANPYAYYNPYTNFNSYNNPYAYYNNPYNYANPYAYYGSYYNPYAVATYPAVNSYTPVSSLYTAY